MVYPGYINVHGFMSWTIEEAVGLNEWLHHNCLLCGMTKTLTAGAIYPAPAPTLSAAHVFTS